MYIMNRNRIKPIFIILLTILIGNGFVNGQSMKAYLEAAEKAFEDKNYGAAMLHYMAANEFDEDRYDVMLKSAESAKMFRAYNISENRYQTIVDNDTINNNPKSNFWLADIKQRLGKYDEAINFYNVYISEYGDDEDYFTQKAKKELEACKWASELVENPSERIEIEHLGDDVNTPHTDFAGVSYNDALIYSSMRFEKENDTNIPNRYVSKLLKKEDGRSTILDTILQHEGKLSAHLAFNVDKSRAYFTICEYEQVADIRCDIYSVDVSDSGVFSNVQKLPEFINNPESTNTQPNVGFNSVLNKEVLYFVSNREGGKGKRDIWYSIMDKNGNLTQPSNLDEINTVEEDITPFYEAKSNTLYFSSEGYRSMGGFDIYAAPFEVDYFGKPVHQGYPLNTSYDDIYYWISNDSKSAYFSSNRPGSLYLDENTEACCFDIYKVNIKPISLDLLALTFNGKTLGELPGTTVKLYDANTNELIGEKTSKDTNVCKFDIQSDHNYYIIASKLGYNSDSTRFNTLGVQKSGSITKKLYLEPKDLKLSVFTFDKTTLNELKGVELTLENLSDDTIDKIVINNFNSNEFNFDILRGHNYKITATRKGYQSVSTIIETNEFDGDLMVKKLYLPDLLNAYIPIVVYFDNDRPNRRSRSKYTNLSYKDTYLRYIKREDQFVDKFTSDLEDPVVKKMSEEQIRDFFKYDVKGAIEKLDLFMSTLEAVLENGHTVAIQLKGYASPRADYKYNLILAQRRVYSVKNQFERYNRGALKKYIKSGKLSITDVSYGESLAPQGISDSINDEKQSVYSVGASKERRVQVVKISTDLINNK